MGGSLSKDQANAVLAYAKKSSTEKAEDDAIIVEYLNNERLSLGLHKQTVFITHATGNGRNGMVRSKSASALYRSEPSSYSSFWGLKKSSVQPIQTSKKSSTQSLHTNLEFLEIVKVPNPFDPEGILVPEQKLTEIQTSEIDPIRFGNLHSFKSIDLCSQRLVKVMPQVGCLGPHPSSLQL